jgi:acyl-CoA thioesterase
MRSRTRGWGPAVYSRIGETESCATIEIKIVYIAAVVEGEVHCESRTVSKGRRVAVLESELRNKDRLVAKALGTFAIFPAKS